MVVKKNTSGKVLVSAHDDEIFQLMYENHSLVMLVIEPLSGQILDANLAAMDFYGYSKEILCGMSIQELEVSSSEQIDVKQQRAFVDKRMNFIFSHRLASGEERKVDVHSSTGMLQGKQVRFAIIHDVTEQKLAENLAEEKMVFERNLLSALLDNLPDRIYVKDMQGRKIISNVADWRASGGKVMEDVLGKTDFDTYLPELAAKYWADDKSVIDSGVPIINREEPGLDSQGNPIWVLTTKVPLRDGNHDVTGLVGIGRDITLRKQVDDALNESKLLFHLLIESLPQNIYAKDVEGRFVFANHHYCALQGKLLDEIVGKTDFELHPPDLAEKYRLDDRHVIETGKTIEIEEEHSPIGGKKFFVQVIKTPFFDSKGQTAGTLGIFWDITGRKEAEAELRRAQDALETAHRELQQSFAREQQLARIDELTGINNHRSLLQLAEHEFNVAMRYRPPLSMMFFDIDYFKHINDTFGHAIGDQVLKRVTKTICANLRSADIIGRYGGDEFVILLPETSAQESLHLAERLHASIAGMRIETEKGPIVLTISIGIAQTIHTFLPDHGHHSETLMGRDALPGFEQTDILENLLLRADRALYSAKQTGRNRTVIFDPAITRTI